MRGYLVCRPAETLVGFLLILLVSGSSCYGSVISTVEVVGTGECADCKERDVKTRHALSGIKVTIECKLEDGKFQTRGVGELDEEGHFKVSLPQEILKDGKLAQECYTQLHNAANAPCAVHSGLEASKITFLSKSNEKHTFGPTGKLKFSSAVCTSAFLWPVYKHPPLPKLPDLPKSHPWLKKFGHAFTLPPLPPKILPPFPLPPKIPFKKPCPPPIVKPPPVPVYKPTPKPPVVEPPPVPIYKPTPKPPVVEPPPVPVYKPKPKPKPKPEPPVYKPKPKPKPPVCKPSPVPVYKPKPKPPVYTPSPVPVYKPKPEPPVYKPKPKPLPPSVPIYKPLPPPIPIYKPLPPLKPHPKILPPPIPIYKPLPPFYKKPCPPFSLPKLPPLPTFPPKHFHHPLIPVPPHP